MIHGFKVLEHVLRSENTVSAGIPYPTLSNPPQILDERISVRTIRIVENYYKSDKLHDWLAVWIADSWDMA